MNKVLIKKSLTIYITFPLFLDDFIKFSNLFFF